MATPQPLWAAQPQLSESLALIDEQGRSISRGELDALVDARAATLRDRGERLLGLLFFRNRLDDLVQHLACLSCGHVALLLPADMPAPAAQALVDLYRPAWLHGAPADVRPATGMPPALHPDLGLLLSTSGSTGSPKLVRLSRTAVQANAASIAAYLQIAPTDRALTTLPPSYSYGISVIHSHLLAGACVALSDASVLSPEFLPRLRELAVTSIAGVPSSWQMLLRTGFDKAGLPALKTITQAGGRLDEPFVRRLHAWAQQQGARFFVMYGQTEATARISYVPPERLADKFGAIGIAIPGGQLSVDDTSSELLYRGSNVMMGYATAADDLTRGDELGGVLRTGDLGHMDEDGFFYVTGRLKRFVKLSGSRIGLDEVESLLSTVLKLPVAAGGRDERLVVAVESADEAVAAQARELLVQRLQLPLSLLRIRLLPALPLLPTGKRDYAALNELA
ncbi:AMP-binding protein [Roseateles sp. BYS78W]|uniref:AMP-binding protein n=1 Tax=Pelomonas candidula TaxID=3299025 RepID=A0ABW7HHU4_9BURK